MNPTMIDVLSRTGNKPIRRKKWVRQDSGPNKKREPETKQEAPKRASGLAVLYTKSRKT